MDTAPANVREKLNVAELREVRMAQRDKMEWMNTRLEVRKVTLGFLGF